MLIKNNKQIVYFIKVMYRSQTLDYVQEILKTTLLTSNSKYPFLDPVFLWSSGSRVSRSEESHFQQCICCFLNHLLLHFPDSRVFHTVALEVGEARFPESLDTVLSVVLEVSQPRLHRIGVALSPQTPQGEMVVEDQNLLRVVETFHILTRLGVVGTPVDVLHYMKILRDVLNMIVLLGIQHLVQEVNIPEEPR